MAPEETPLIYCEACFDRWYPGHDCGTGSRPSSPEKGADEGRTYTTDEVRAIIAEFAKYMGELKKCACGLPLHYSNPEHREMVEYTVAKLGECVRVKTHDGSFMVPRHFIALHGIKAEELPELASRYGWETSSGEESK